MVTLPPNMAQTRGVLRHIIFSLQMIFLTVLLPSLVSALAPMQGGWTQLASDAGGSQFLDVGKSTPSLEGWTTPVFSSGGRARIHSPLTFEEYVVVSSDPQGLVVLNASTGAKIPGLFDAKVTVAVAILDDRSLVGVTNSSLVRVALNGTEIWNVPFPEPPKQDTTTPYYSVAEDILLTPRPARAFSVETGKLLWTYKEAAYCLGAVSNGAVPCSLYSDTGGSGAVGLDLRTGKRLWTETKGSLITQGSVSLGITITSDEDVTGINTTTGDVLWSTSSGSSGAFSATLHENWLYTLNDDVLLVFDILSGKKWAADSPSECFAAQSSAALCCISTHTILCTKSVKSAEDVNFEVVWHDPNKSAFMSSFSPAGALLFTWTSGDNGQETGLTSIPIK